MSWPMGGPRMTADIQLNGQPPLLLHMCSPTKTNKVILTVSATKLHLESYTF